jgi:uncharacterized protein (DUF2252 family)
MAAPVGKAARRGQGSAPAVPAASEPQAGESPAERAAKGKSLRSQVPRSSHADWEPPADRPDPIALLEAQSADRVQELIPIRYGRMSASPFEFFRGAAAVMASDLAGSAATGLLAQLCGDAHVSNFGAFASAERELLFDVNDFDETLPGPWEWDVKRLAASVAVAGRANGFSGKQRESVICKAVSEYRSAMRGFAGMTNLAVWYASARVEDVRQLIGAQGDARQLRGLDKSIAKGKRKDNARAFAKLAVTEGGRPRIRADPPLIVPVDQLTDKAEAEQIRGGAWAMFEAYLATLPGDMRELMRRYHYTDVARKVVGVGSVGTRCWVALFLGRDGHDPLFLQGKEAGRSVLEIGARRSRFVNQGRRVVEGQQLVQAAGDPFLGWLRAPEGLVDGKPTDYYVRQLWDAKTSADIGAMRPEDLEAYARLCGWTLARGHARSGDAIAMGSYLGSSEVFDRAIARFAEAYADQNERDHKALLDAIAGGRVPAEPGV